MLTPITYTPDFVVDPAKAFSRLWNELDWLDIAGPRLEYYINDHNVNYTYGRGAGERSYAPQLMHPVVRDIRAQLEALTGTVFDVCFLNGYRDGQDQLGWHADNSPEMDDECPIAIVSLGAKREIYFREATARLCPDCHGKPGQIHSVINCNRGADVLVEDDHCQTYMAPTVEKLWLESGSLCLMKPGMQDTHEHRIPKSSVANCGPRISLTFRHYVHG